MAYKVYDKFGLYSITFTIVGWIDVFTRECYKKVLVESLNYCTDRKGLYIHCWTIMSNHVHLIVTCDGDLTGVIRDLKQFTAKSFLKLIQSENESRREWLMHMFQFHARFNKANSNYQVWQHGYHAVELTTDAMIEQRIDYIEENPIRAGIVRNPEDFIYSSAGSPELVLLTPI